MIIINVKKMGSIEKALKNYKYRVYKSGQTVECMERSEFTKKSARQRKTRKKAIYREKKKNQDI